MCTDICILDKAPTPGCYQWQSGLASASMAYGPLLTQFHDSINYRIFCLWIDLSSITVITLPLADTRVLSNYLELNIFYSKFTIFQPNWRFNFAPTINQSSMLGSWTRIQAYGPWLQKGRDGGNPLAEDKSEARLLCIFKWMLQPDSVYHTHLRHYYLIYYIDKNWTVGASKTRSPL